MHIHHLKVWQMDLISPYQCLLHTSNFQRTFTMRGKGRLGLFLISHLGKLPHLRLDPFAFLEFTLQDIDGSIQVAHCPKSPQRYLMAGGHSTIGLLIKLTGNYLKVTKWNVWKLRTWLLNTSPFGCIGTFLDMISFCLQIWNQLRQLVATGEEGICEALEAIKLLQW